MTDTPPEIAPLVRQKLMARSNEERFMMGIRSFDAMREIVQSSPNHRRRPRNLCDRVLVIAAL